MEIFLASLIAFLAIALAMGVGVIFRGRSLRGSCGGVGSGQCACGATVGEECRNATQEETKNKKSRIAV